LPSNTPFRYVSSIAEAEDDDLARALRRAHRVCSASAARASATEPLAGISESVLRLLIRAAFKCRSS
jgi:hypothetical protein